jgi:hypothetical protein
MIDDTGPEAKVDTELQCFHCGEELDAEAQVCPVCGRKQHRVCYCGLRLRPDVAECPRCGADWQEIVRRKRRSRSSRVKPQKLIRSAATGALGTLLGAVLLNLIISALATRSTPDGEIPASLLLRFGYAGQTLGQAFVTLFNRLMGMGLGAALGVALLGAVGGGVWYLARLGALRWARWAQDKDHRGTRRRRRTI